MGRPRIRDDELRGRLLEGALGLLADGGVGAVTTRAVAASAETSIPAVHELFGGKGGLVRAMFAEGFDVLAGDLEVLETTGDAEQDLLELVWAFRRFAVGRPQLFDVMFSRPFAEFRPDADDLRVSETIYQVVMQRVGAVVGPSTPGQVRKDAAIGLFGVVQGLANLELAGILGSGSASIERRWRTTVLATVNGLRDPLTAPTAGPPRHAPPAYTTVASASRVCHVDCGGWPRIRMLSR